MLKIDDCRAVLKDSELALEAAPEKGFVDLDKIKSALKDAGAFLEQISPRLALGEKLIAATRSQLLARLNVLKSSGGGALVSQAESYLKSENLDYERLKTLEAEIAESINAIFGGFSKHTKQLNAASQAPAKPEDYRC